MTAAGLIASLGVVVIPDARAAFPGTDGMIAVTRGGDIWLHTLGGDWTPLTDQGDAGSPRWAPDGRHLAFPRDGQAVVLDLKTGHQSVVRGLDDVVDVSWAPSGHGLAVSRTVADRPATIWTVALNGSHLDRIMRPGANATSGLQAPAWSSDGRYVAALVNAPCPTRPDFTCRQVTVLDLDEGERMRIAMSAGSDTYISVGGPQVTFSPDSSRLFVGLAVVEGGFDSLSVGRYDLRTREFTTFYDEDCRISGSGACYLRGGWGQATPSGGIASLYVPVNGDFDNTPCYGVYGTMQSECDEAWWDVTGFDVQPVH